MQRGKLGDAVCGSVPLVVIDLEEMETVFKGGKNVQKGDGKQVERLTHLSCKKCVDEGQV